MDLGYVLWLELLVVGHGREIGQKVQEKKENKRGKTKTRFIKDLLIPYKHSIRRKTFIGNKLENTKDVYVTQGSREDI